MFISANLTPAIVNHASASELSVKDLKTLATAAAIARNLPNINHFLDVIQGESGWQYNADSPTNDHGLCQINAPSWPAITLAQAYDPYFCLNWMAQQWQEGHARYWSKYREYAKNGWPSG